MKVCTWGVLEARTPSKIAPCVSQGVPQRALWHPMWFPNEHLGHPKRVLKRALGSTKGDPKVDKNGSRDPFGPQGGSKTQTGPRTQLEGPAFLAPLAARGRSKVPFWTQGGSQKGSKIDMGRQGRHLWGPRWAKRLFKRGS